MSEKTMDSISVKTKKSQSETGRIRSIDVVRGLTVLVMFFVNDLSGVSGAPAWMMHFSPPLADGMTFVDIVFPAFLFIVGLSLPLALECRLRRGASLFSVGGHILTRTFNLLVIGVFMVNTENISKSGLIDTETWKVLMCLGVCLVWLDSKGQTRLFFRIRRSAGIILLAVLAVIYRGELGLVGMRPQWWGILGQIGWAYIVNAFLYLLFRRRAVWYFISIIVLYGVYIADAEKMFAFLGEFNRWIDIGPVFGTHAAITATGALLGLSLVKDTEKHSVRIFAALLMAAGLGTAAVSLHYFNDMHRAFTYNKILATLPWGLLSSAVTSLLFAVVYFAVDVFKLGFGTCIIDLAGQNSLFAFIFDLLFYSLLVILSFNFPGIYHWWRLGRAFITGLYRAIIFAVTATGLTALLKRMGLSFKV